MTRRLPPHPFVAEVDTLVAALDAATVGKESPAPTTSSYAAIVDAWDSYRDLVDQLDVAVSAPLSLGAPQLFRRAPELVNERAHKLAFWLQHVGEAVFRTMPGRDRRRARDI